MTDYRRLLELRFCLTFIHGLAERALERDDPDYYREYVLQIEKDAREALERTTEKRAA